MRGDFSRFNHDTFNRYIATFMQQGRLQLDSDWNENVENFLNMLWKQSRDFLGTCACIGDSFRIGKDIPIDHMLHADLWKPVYHDKELSPDLDGYIFLNTNDRPHADTHSPSEKGSLFVQNAEGILREFNDLDLSRFKSIYVTFKVIGRSFKTSPSTHHCPKCNQPYKRGENQYCSKCGTELKEDYSENEDSCNSINKDVQTWLRLDNYEFRGQFVDSNPDAGGFCKVKFNLLKPLKPETSSERRDKAESVEEYDISHISKFCVLWEKDDNTASAVCIGLISAEPMALVVSADPEVSISGSWANNISNLNNDNNKIINQALEQNSVSYLYKGKPTIEKRKGIKEISWSFSSPKNFHSLHTLRLAIRNENIDSNNNSTAYAYKLFLVNSTLSSKEYKLEYSVNPESEQDNGPWKSYIIDVQKPDIREESAVDDLQEILKEIKTIGIKGLPDKGSLYISEILGEINFENDFLISGDTDLSQSATMYVNGIQCSIDHWNTYLTQRDSYLIQRDTSSDNVNNHLIYSPVDLEKENNSESKGERQKDAENSKNPILYLAYVRLWNQGFTALERPEFREVALGGPDTATKLQTICQVKLRKIDYDKHNDGGEDNGHKDGGYANFVDKIVRNAEREIKEMNKERSARLSIISPRKRSSLLSPDANKPGRLGNYHYRVQIHDSGEIKANYNSSNGSTIEDIDNRGTVKWSKDNASVAFSIKQLSKENVVLEPGARSLVGVFRIGDLIEIMDDIDELSEKPKGRMRRITEIDIDKRILSWGSSRSNPDQLEVKDLHEQIKIEAGRYQPELHPKVILWDGIKYVNPTQEEGDAGRDEGSSDRLISLEGSWDGNGPIKIKFDPGMLRCGDYWTFTTRSNGDIEKLMSAKPMGPKYAHAPLALIKQEIGKEIEVLKDLRHTFQQLSNLKAIDIPYDNEDHGKSGTSNVQAAISNVQSAIQKLSDGNTHILHGHGNKDNISDLLIQAGEIYTLKPAKGGKRNFRRIISFNDVYQHPPILIYNIRSAHNNKPSDIIHKIRMIASDENGNIVKEAHENTARNYGWIGFEVEANEDAQLSWLTVGDSYTYFERFVKRVLDQVFRVFFGVDTDQLKEDTSILDAWHRKNLQNLSHEGIDLASQAKENWNAFQDGWDRFIRKVDKQGEALQKEIDEVFGTSDEEENEENEQSKGVFSAQTINCPSCGRSYPQGKYTFCTNCGTKMSS